MARKRRVTRTIKSLEVTYLAINTETMEPYNDITYIPFDTKENKIENVVREIVNVDTNKLIEIVNVETVTEHRAMDENDFIANSYVIGADEVEENEAE